MENNYKYIIYQTINIVNNKIYIGRHKEKDINVFSGYIGCGVNINYPSTYKNPYTAFQYAVKKYGTNNFKRSILYVFDTFKEARDKEAEIVNEEFIKRKDTYNMVVGGGGDAPKGYSIRKIYQYDINGNLIKEWKNCSEISDTLNVWEGTIYQAIHQKHRYKEFYWSYESSINLKDFCSPQIPQRVYKYSKDGKLMEMYDSMYIAAKENNYKLCELSSRIKEQALTKGFYYSTTLYDEYIPKQKLSIKGKLLYLYTKEGNFFKEMKAEDIMKEFNIENRRICYAIKTHGLIGEYLVSTEKMESVEPYKGRKKSTKVKLFDLNGNFIDTCDSIQMACKKYNLDGHAIRKCLKGTQKTTKGYIIKEVIDDIV